MINSDPNFYFPSSSSLPIPNQNQKLRKKRTKLNKIEPNLVPSSNTIPNSIVTYRKKPDPSAPKITKPCTECGKKFWSEKALYGHMRCHPERQWRGINPPPNYCRAISTPIQELGNNNKNPNQAVMTIEDHEVAACLLLLSNSDSASVTYNTTSSSNFQVEEDVMNCRFECSSCKKVFGSHQALGGHRASHKNVKGCFAITRSSDGCEIVDEDHGGDCSGGGRTVEDTSFNNNSKMLMVFGHKCSICLRVFSSGQALGGHKRCHWEKGEEAASSSMNQAKESCGLDLNLPAPVDHQDESSSSYSSDFTLDLRLGL